MFVTKILHILQDQEKILNVKIRKAQKDNVRLLFMKTLRKFLRSLQETVWMLHLVKTSILVTRTPLTTLKCMPKAAINQTIKP
jgi:hypothetical protein